MKRLLCAFLAVLTLLTLTACGETQLVRSDLFAMDTYMSLAAYGDHAQEALTAAAREINRLERELSRTVDGSDISKLNADGTAAISEETASLLSKALAYSDATGGLFDITVAPLVALWGITTDAPRVPAQSEIDALLPLVGSAHIHINGSEASLDAGCGIDLGGIAKGYASDRVAEVFRAYGITGAVVSLGGNAYVCGTKPDGRAWSVEVRDPRNEEGSALLFSLTDAFAVTSGGYQRFFTADDGTVYQHIIDPRTGKPTQSDLLSVTIVAKNGTMADAYSTALYVMGAEDACAFWRENSADFEMILITADSRVLYTQGLSDSITQRGDGYDFQEIKA